MARARGFAVTHLPHPVLVVLSFLLVVTLLVWALSTSDVVALSAALAAAVCAGFALVVAGTQRLRVPASALARGPPLR
jgi:hypothetical protein